MFFLHPYKNTLEPYPMQFDLRRQLYLAQKRASDLLQPLDRSVDGIVPVRKNESQKKSSKNTCTCRPSQIMHNWSCPVLTGQQSSESVGLSNTIAPERQETTIGGSCREAGDFGSSHPCRKGSLQFQHSSKTTKIRVRILSKN